jgi:hypothetical protein
MTRPQVCGAQAYLPADLVPEAMALESVSGWAEASDVTRHLRCTLEAHGADEHYSIVMDLSGMDTGAVWTHWAAGCTPDELVVLRDCPLTGQGGEPCREYEGHPGGCSPQVYDPWDDWSRRPSDNDIEQLLDEHGL